MASMDGLLSWMPSQVERLAERVERRIVEAVKTYRLEPVFVSFSGGKDSSAALAASVNALGTGLVVGYFMHIPGQTVRDNVIAARRVAEALGLLWETVVWRHGDPLPAVGGTVYHIIQANAPYQALLRVNGPPSPPPRPRWCCRLYKEDPLGHAPCWRTVVNGRERCARIVVAGVKRADSRARARRWSDSYVKVFRRKGSVDIAVSPLVDLSDADVWALLRNYGIYEIVAEQYRAWGRSPNCVLCPLSGRGQLERAARKLPTAYLRNYLRALDGWDTDLARRMRNILEAELARRGENDG